MEPVPGTFDASIFRIDKGPGGQRGTGGPKAAQQQSANPTDTPENILSLLFIFLSLC